MIFRLLIAGLCLLNIKAYAQDSIYTEVDRLPVFEGCHDPFISETQQQACSLERIAAFIQQNLVYPDTARKTDVQGVVIVRFVINEDGQVSMLQLVNDIGAECGQEALRVVRLFPNWKPARKNDQAVAYQYDLPIRFRLTDALGETQNIYRINWGNTYSDLVTKKDVENLLNDSLFVRDYYGNILALEDLELTYIRGRRAFTLENTTGQLSAAMKKMLRRKLRKRGAIVLLGHIQEGLQRIEVVRELELKKEE